MDFQDYRVRVEALGNALAADSRFRAVVDVYPALSGNDFEDIASDIREGGLPDFKLWPALREFYAVLDGFQCQWQYLGNGSVTTKTGSAMIAILPAILLPEDAPPDSVKQMYSEPRVFDLIGPDDHVALRLHPEPKAPELLYFADTTKRYHSLSLNFETYLEALLEARAMYRWQQFFIAEEGFTISKDDASAFRLSLSTIFPEANVERFRAEYER